MSGAGRRLSLQYGAALVATVGLLSLGTYIVWQQRAESHALAEASIRGSARVLAGQTEHAFDQAGALLTSVGLRYAHTALNKPQELRALTEEVRREVPHYPLIKRVGIIDTEGINFFNTGFTTGGPNRIDLRERSYYQRAKAGEQNLMFEGPLLTKLNHEWALVLARRINGPNGEFVGVVFGTVPVAALGDSYARVDLGPGGIINLRTEALA